MTLTGADAATVRRALERGQALPGTAGFAGALDGRLVRDVLGREPLFSEADDPGTWSHDPHDLSQPRRLPAGHVRGGAGTAERWTLPDPEPVADEAAGVEPVTPLLHDRVIRAALDLPGEFLVAPRGDRKWALRLAARDLLPDRLAFREKKAVQYGSRVARELDRLARQVGFKRRMDDHVTRFVEHCADATPRERLDRP